MTERNMRIAARIIKASYPIHKLREPKNHTEFISVREAFVKYFVTLESVNPKTEHFDRDKFRALCLPDIDTGNLTVDS